MQHMTAAECMAEAARLDQLATRAKRYGASDVVVGRLADRAQRLWDRALDGAA